MTTARKVYLTSLKKDGLVLYMITCKYNPNDKVVSKNNLISTCNSKGIELQSYLFEGDGSNTTDEKLHLHGVFYAKPNLYYKDYAVKNYNMFIRQCWSTNGESYCLKSARSEYKIKKAQKAYEKLYLSENSKCMFRVSL